MDKKYRPKPAPVVSSTPHPQNKFKLPFDNEESLMLSPIVFNAQRNEHEPAKSNHLVSIPVKRTALRDGGIVKRKKPVQKEKEAVSDAVLKELKVNVNQIGKNALSHSRYNTFSEPVVVDSDEEDDFCLAKYMSKAPQQKRTRQTNNSTAGSATSKKNAVRAKNLKVTENGPTKTLSRSESENLEQPTSFKSDQATGITTSLDNVANIQATKNARPKKKYTIADSPSVVLDETDSIHSLCIIAPDDISDSDEKDEIWAPRAFKEVRGQPSTVSCFKSKRKKNEMHENSCTSEVVDIRKKRNATCESHLALEKKQSKMLRFISESENHQQPSSSQTECSMNNIIPLENEANVQVTEMCGSNEGKQCHKAISHTVVNLEETHRNSIFSDDMSDLDEKDEIQVPRVSKEVKSQTSPLSNLVSEGKNKQVRQENCAHKFVDVLAQTTTIGEKTSITTRYESDSVLKHKGTVPVEKQSRKTKLETGPILRNNRLLQSKKTSQNKSENCFASDCFSQFQNVVFKSNKHCGGIVAKCLDTGRNDFGFLEVTKDEVFTGSRSNTTFVVLEGEVEATQMGTNHTLLPGDIWHVKNDGEYHLKSAKQKHARLLYVRERS